MPWNPVRFPDDVPVLRSGDVTVRPHRASDLAAVVEQCRDPEMARWTEVPVDYTPEHGRQFLDETVPAGWSEGTVHSFAVEGPRRDGSSGFVGTVDLRERGPGRAETGFGAHPDARGTGAMTTALGLVLGYGFDALGLQVVSWTAVQGNWASRKLAWRVGFTFGGTWRRWLMHRGTAVDAWVGTLSRDDPREPAVPWWSLPVLHGDRVAARPFAPEDAARMVEGGNDVDVQRWMPSFPSPYLPADADRFSRTTLDEAAAGTSFSWALVDPTDDTFLGAVGIPHRSDTGVEIGYWLHPDARGLGYARDAVALIVDHAFTPRDLGGLGALRAFVRIDEGNLASQAVARACGFEMAGSERFGVVRRDGTIADMLVLDRVNPLVEGL